MFAGATVSNTTMTTNTAAAMVRMTQFLCLGMFEPEGLKPPTGDSRGSAIRLHLPAVGTGTPGGRAVSCLAQGCQLLHSPFCSVLANPAGRTQGRAKLSESFIIDQIFNGAGVLSPPIRMVFDRSRQVRLGNFLQAVLDVRKHKP